VDFNSKIIFRVQKVFHYTRWKSVVGSTVLSLHPLGGKNPQQPWIRDWVDSKIGLDVVAKKSIIMHFPGSKPGCPVRITTTTIFVVYSATLSVACLYNLERMN
jgi:hypothetical protein